MLIPTSPNRRQVGELTTGNGNSPTSGCQFSPDSYLGELPKMSILPPCDVNSVSIPPPVPYWGRWGLTLIGA